MTGRGEVRLRYVQEITDFIFVRHAPRPVDIAFLPGSPYAETALQGARMYREGYAPLLLPSGRFSVTLGRFPGPQSRAAEYPGPYESEWAFYRDVLMRGGVPEHAILREDQATYTYENAIYSRRVTDALGVEVRSAMICCKEQHARRALMYYETLYPDAEFIVCPVSAQGITRDNWTKTEAGIDAVLDELARCGGQFHAILKEKLL